MHSIRVLEAPILIPPGSGDRRVYLGSPMREQSLRCGLQIGHLQRKADLAADSAAYLNLVDSLGLLFVKDFKNSLA